MGYSTTLYAVELEKLRAAVGSNDAALLERVRAAVRDAGETGEVDPYDGPRVMVTRSSQIFLNRRPVTLEEMRAGLRDPRWAGTNIFFYHERGRKEGVWADELSFFQALQASLVGTRIGGISCCNAEEELYERWEEDEISAEQAAVELIAGKLTSPECSYGYGLELLCQVVGARLGVIEGKGRLKALKLDTPLTEVRSPVPLPDVDEFPYVGFLTADEVQREVERLSATDLAYPKSPAIAEDRREFLRLLRTAAEQGRAVVSFYH